MLDHLVCYQVQYFTTFIKVEAARFFFFIYLINQNFNFHSTVNTTETSSLSKINLQSSTFHFQLTTGLEPSPSDISVHFSKKKNLGFYLFKTYHRSLIKAVFLFLKPNQNSTSYIPLVCKSLQCFNKSAEAMDI